LRKKIAFGEDIFRTKIKQLVTSLRKFCAAVQAGTPMAVNEDGTLSACRAGCFHSHSIVPGGFEVMS